MRLLGVELTGEGPKCQRFAGIVDDGILLRLVSLLICDEDSGRRVGMGPCNMHDLGVAVAWDVALRLLLWGIAAQRHITHVSKAKS